MISPNTRYRFVKATNLVTDVVPAGTIFETDEKGYANNIGGTTHAVHSGSLNNWLEDGRIEEVGRWEPNNNQVYFYITGEGLVREQNYLGGSESKRRSVFGNMFETREQAESVRDSLKYLLNNLKF